MWHKLKDYKCGFGWWDGWLALWVAASFTRKDNFACFHGSLGLFLGACATTKALQRDRGAVASCSQLVSRPWQQVDSEENFFDQISVRRCFQIHEAWKALFYSAEMACCADKQGALYV